MTVGEEAVKAAEIELSRIIGEWERNREYLNVSPEPKRNFIRRQASSLTAALPHLPGVGVRPMETAPKGEDAEKPSVIEVHEGAWAIVKGTNGKDAGWIDTHELFAHQLYRHRILSALEPSAARELALEEGYRQGIEAATQKAAEMLVFADTTSTADREIPAAIRALGTSCEQLNKAVSNVPDQQENEPGAHGERERALEESLSETRTDLVILQGTVAHAAKTDRRWEGMYERVGSWIKRIDAALSSPVHADAGKLVEGDGWLPMTHPDLPLNGASVVMFDSFVPGKDGFGQVIARFDKTHGWHVSASVVGGKYIQLTNPIKWRPLFSAPSQEVAGS